MNEKRKVIGWTVKLTGEIRRPQGGEYTAEPTDFDADGLDLMWWDGPARNEYPIATVTPIYADPPPEDRPVSELARLRKMIHTAKRKHRTTRPAADAPPLLRSYQHNLGRRLDAALLIAIADLEAADAERRVMKEKLDLVVRWALAQPSRDYAGLATKLRALVEKEKP